MASKEMIIEILNIRQLKRPVVVTGPNLIPCDNGKTDMVNMKNKRERLKKASENVVVVTRKRPRPKIVKSVPAPTQKKEIKKPPAKKKVERPPAKKKQIDPAFRDRVKKDLNEILPEKMPWKLRIDRDLFHMLKDKYPDERTKLRKMICSILNYRTSAIAYIKVLETAEYRYGFDLKEYPLSDEHRESCRRRIIDIKKLLNKRRKKRDNSVA